MKRETLGNLALLAALLLFVYQLVRLQQAVRDAARLEAAPLFYPAAWQPVGQRVKPGQALRFTYARHNQQPGLLLLTVDSFQNVETGAAAPGALLVQYLPNAGEERAEHQALIPPLAPGRYRLVGWSAPQNTDFRTKAAYYVSEPFEVIR